MPVITAVPFLAWMLTLIVPSFHTYVLSIHWLTESWLLISVSALVLSLAALMRQWSWWYWVGLALGIWHGVELLLAAPLSAERAFLLHTLLPLGVLSIAWLLSAQIRPPLWTLGGVVWLCCATFWPWLLVALPLSEWQPVTALMNLVGSGPLVAGIAAPWSVLLAVALLLGLWLWRRMRDISQPRQWAELFIGVLLVALVLSVQSPLLLRMALLAAMATILLGLTMQMLNLAYIDELTQIPGRRALYAEMRKMGKRSALTMLDVDHFKKFNDTYGHDVGDQVLKLIASQLKKAQGCKAYRYGGEEFTLLFAHNDAERIEQSLQEVRQQIANYPLRLRTKQRPKSHKKGQQQRGKAGSKSVRVTISLGCAIRQAKESESALLKRADTLLYKAKKAGRNCVVMG